MLIGARLLGHKVDQPEVLEVPVADAVDVVSANVQGVQLCRVKLTFVSKNRFYFNGQTL